MSQSQIGARNTDHPATTAWVEKAEALCRPDRIFWCDGSDAEKEFLIGEAVRQGVLVPLNQEKWPGCYCHRSNPNDVARVEQFTYICTPLEEEAGPTNNWAPPAEMYSKLYKMAEGSMRGRNMYVVPYLMGPPGSPLSKVGIELTDSIYVVLSMGVMTRMAAVAYEHLGDSRDFNRGLHCVLDVNPERRLIAHFPQDNTIISVGSNYGGNALLGEVPQSADRIVSGPPGRLDGRAHADPGRGGSPGAEDLCSGSLSQRLRENKFRHADSAKTARRLENLDRGRRHRLDETRPGWPALGD
jgi:phosphoenolpyruvate carboxykinase (GTP)